jgi:Choline/Carnitine o-acyltransferase
MIFTYALLSPAFDCEPTDTYSACWSQVLHYEGYGKDYIKRYKLSPDAWAQLVKQLAFHKMFGRPGVAYESAQTRKYQLGRTEVIRGASNETKAWAEAMLNQAETVRGVVQLFVCVLIVCMGAGRESGEAVPRCGDTAYAVLGVGY